MLAFSLLPKGREGCWSEPFSLASKSSLDIKKLQLQKQIYVNLLTFLIYYYYYLDHGFHLDKCFVDVCARHDDLHIPATCRQFFV